MGILRDTMGGEGRRRGRSPTPPDSTGAGGEDAPLSDPGAAQPREQVPAGPDSAPAAAAQGRPGETRVAGTAPGATPFRARTFGEPARESQPIGSPEPPTMEPSFSSGPALEPPPGPPLAPAPQAPQPPAAAGPPPAAPPPHMTAAPAPSGPASEQARSELQRRRDALAEEVTELHWDLGGLAYEMAIRDHFRLDVLVRRAAVLQERDAELAELERLLQMEEGGIAGSCPSCAAPHSRGAVYCWQCGGTLMGRSQSSALPESATATAVVEGLLPPGAPGVAPHNGSDG